MAELDDERRLAVFEAFDQGEFPQWTVPVESVHHRPARELENRLPCPGSGSGDPADMPVQVEVRIVAPPGGGQAEGDSATRWRSEGMSRVIRSTRDQGIPVRGAVNSRRRQ